MSALKCLNYELCQNKACDPISNEFCMSCGYWYKRGFGWDALEFRDTDQECAICNELKCRELKFPTNCGHYFCIDCSKDLLYYNEQRYYLSPVPFGCPPCPNGCINPVKGIQCDCLEYDAIEEAWKYSHYVDYIRWQDATSESIKEGDRNSVYGKKQCPLCRKKYKRMCKTCNRNYYKDCTCNNFQHWSSYK